MENKKSKLIFDPRISRKLLKMNGEIRFCPYCGKSIEENCECHKNIVIDIKPYRNMDGKTEADKSVIVFLNNESFYTDYNNLTEEVEIKKSKNVPEQEPKYEQLTLDDIM